MLSAVDMTEKLLSTGGTTGGLTVIVTSDVEDSAVSLAVSRNTYVPEVENVARVFSELACRKTTAPGPLNLDQDVWSVPGNPSSVAVPDRLAPEGNVIV